MKVGDLAMLIEERLASDKFLDWVGELCVVVKVIDVWDHVRIRRISTGEEATLSRYKVDVAQP